MTLSFLVCQVLLASGWFRVTYTLHLPPLTSKIYLSIYLYISYTWQFGITLSQQLCERAPITNQGNEGLLPCQDDILGHKCNAL